MRNSARPANARGGHNAHLSRVSFGDVFETTTTVVVPPDGGYGWVVVFAAFLVNFILDGIIGSCGLYMGELISEFGGDTSSIALVGSLLVGLEQLVGPVASGIANRFGFRTTLMLGGLIACGGFVGAHYSPSLTVLYCTNGVIAGMGFGLVYMPAALIVNFYFTRWRALAVSIALIGCNVGGAVVPIIIGRCIIEYGWRMTIFVQAGMLLFCTLLGLLFRHPPSATVAASSGAAASYSLMGFSTAHGAQVNKSYMSVMALVGGNYERGGMPTVRPSQMHNVHRDYDDDDDDNAKGCWTRFVYYLRCQCCRCCRRAYHPQGVRPMYRDDIFYGGSTLRLTQYRAHDTPGDPSYNLHMTRIASEQDLLEEMESRCVILPHAVRRTVATMVDLTLLCSLPMLLMMASCACASAAFYAPFIFLPDRAMTVDKMDATTATYYVTAISLGAIAGRLVTAVIASLPCANHFYIQSTSQTLGGLAVVAFGFDLPYEVQLGCCMVYGLTFACTSNLRSLIIVDLVGLPNLTNAFGLLLMFQGIAFIIGPPLVGMILSETDSYSTAFWFSGGLILVSAVLTYPLYYIKKKHPSGDYI